MNRFSIDYKKLLLLVVFISLIALIGYLIWRIFFFNPSVTEQSGGVTTSGQTGSLPTAPVGAPGQVIPGENEGGLPANPETDQQPGNQPTGPQPSATPAINDITVAPVVGPVLEKNSSDLQYYNPSDNRFYKINDQGVATAMSDKQFYNVQNVTWSPTTDKAILEYPDGNKIVYDFTKKQQVTLPSHWQEFNFSPDGEKIAFKSIGAAPENIWLASASSDGTRTQKIEQIGDNADKVLVSWSPNNQVVGFYSQGIDADRKKVLFIGANGENFPTMDIQGRGFQPNWSPKGDQLLYSIYSSQSNWKPDLWIADAQGEDIGNNMRPLNIATWASKCAFKDTKEIYCAVPNSLQDGEGMFSYKANESLDSIYKFNLENNSKILISDLDGNYNASKIIIPKDNDFIYFVDGRDNRLRKLNLK